MLDKLVYDGWLKVYKRSIKNKTYDIIKNYDAISVFILNENKEVLLVKQFRPALMKYTLEIPAGVMDIEKESIEECALRELKEETGLSVNINELKLLVAYKPMMGFSDSTMYVFSLEIKKTQLESDLIKDDDVTEVQWITLNKLKESIDNKTICDSKTLMAFFYYMSYNKK